MSFKKHFKEPQRVPPERKVAISNRFINIYVNMFADNITISYDKSFLLEPGRLLGNRAISRKGDELHD